MKTRGVSPRQGSGEMRRHVIRGIAVAAGLAASTVAPGADPARARHAPGGLALRARAVAPDAPTPASLGRKIFFDPSLSASGAMACSTCHDPAHAHAQTNGLAVQLGGPLLDAPGTRAVPSLRYLN